MLIRSPCGVLVELIGSLRAYGALSADCGSKAWTRTTVSGSGVSNRHPGGNKHFTLNPLNTSQQKYFEPVRNSRRNYRF